MTDKSGGKKLVRDVQKRTGWKYVFCVNLVDRLGYEAVSQAIDDNEGTMVDLANTLNARASANGGGT